MTSIYQQALDSEFVFALFCFLLCGVSFFVTWLDFRVGGHPGKKSLRWMLAGFALLGLSFGLRTIDNGLALYFTVSTEIRGSVWLPLIPAGLICIAEALVPTRRRGRALLLWSALYLMARAVLGFLVSDRAAIAVASDLVALMVLLAVVVRIRKCKKLCTWAEVEGLLAVKGALMMDMALALTIGPGHWLWVGYQVLFSLGLFGFAYSVGETSPYLFHRVFIRIHLTFILLASVLTLVIIQSEKSQYLDILRDVSQDAGQAVATRLAAVMESGASLEEAIRGPAVGDEMRQVWAGDEYWESLRFSDSEKRFEVRLPNGELQVSPLGVRSVSDPHLLTYSLPAGAARVEIVGGRRLTRHVRSRIMIIFGLFTVIVGVATVAIGGVVRNAEKTIVSQSAEIQHSQRRMMEDSKLAAIGEVVSTVAHEVNNPSGVILSRASYMLSPAGRAGLSGEQTGDLETIVEQAKRIGNTTRRLLMLAHREGGQTRLLEIDSLVEKALGLVGHRWRPTIAVERRIADSATVLGNEDALLQVLINLLDNAIDAMPDGGRLVLTAYNSEQEEAVLEIEDSGCGVYEEALPLIFDSFFSTKPAGEGTGLGLAIVQRIVKEHGGTIEAQNAPRGGMRFTVRLPSGTGA